MKVKKIINKLQNLSLLFLIIVETTLSLDKELPSFLELPAPIQYYYGESILQLKCDVWPSTAKVKFVISSKRIWLKFLNPSQNTLELNLIDSNIGDLTSPGKLRITKSNHLNNIQDQNIHCLTATDFATVLSRPFRITRARISDFAGYITGNAKVVKKSFLRGNVAIIDCWPPESYPRAQVKFNFNNNEITEGVKYRIIQWPDGKKVSLLIHPIEQSDEGQYRCMATNIMTSQTKLSPEIVNLTIEIPQTSIAPSIIMPISGRTSGPQQITAWEGTNVTLFCIMRGAPPPQIQIYNYNNDLTSNNRYSVDHDFGLLKINDLKVTDAGSYMCSDKYLTSSAVLHVIEALNITIRPMGVILDNFAGSVNFECESSKSSIVVQWLFNGRPISSTFNGTLHIQSVTVTNLGVYQCVAQDYEEWVSALAILSIKSYNLISQTSIITEVSVRPPLFENIDKQEHVLSIPSVKRIFDNLAVYVSWKVNIDRNIGNMSYFVLQYSQKSHTETWSAAITFQEKINVTYYYVTNRYVAPQNIYRYKVHAFFKNGHTITSNWSSEVDFLNVGHIAPLIEEATSHSPKSIYLRWSYGGGSSWPVDVFRILVRQLVNTTIKSKRFGNYIQKDVLFPSKNTTINNLESGITYQVTVYGINDRLGRRSITKCSEPRMVFIQTMTETSLISTFSSNNRFFSGLLQSWKSNKLLYSCLLALTGFLLIMIFLLLVLCIFRQHRHNNKDTSSSHAYQYPYKDVNKRNLADNNVSTLQMPGRMSQYSSQLALHQFQANSRSGDQQTNDIPSRIYNAGSSHAIETASLVTDINRQKYIQGIPMEHIQSQYHGYSTLPQGHPSSYNHRNNLRYTEKLQQQHQQQYEHMNSLLRQNPLCVPDRDSIFNQFVDIPSKNTTVSQEQLSQLQSQQHKVNMTYYNSRPEVIFQQRIGIPGSQQSLGSYGQYNNINTQKYPEHTEPPIAVIATENSRYHMDQKMIDTCCRPSSPYFQYIQQKVSQQGAVHPLKIKIHNQFNPYIRPSGCSQQNLYRRSDGSIGRGSEHISTCLPTGYNAGAGMSRRNIINLPEIPIDLDSNSKQEQNSPYNIATIGSNDSGFGRHHHRRKSRSRQKSLDDNLFLEGIHNNDIDLPPMLAPRSKMTYRLSGHDVDIKYQHMAGTDLNSESIATGNQFEPPLQFASHYDHCNLDTSDADPNNSLLMENLPRLREGYGHVKAISRCNQSNQLFSQHQDHASSSKTNIPQNNLITDFKMDNNPAHTSSVTSNECLRPSPPPTLSHSDVPLIIDYDGYTTNQYHQGSRHL